MHAFASALAATHVPVYYSVRQTRKGESVLERSPEEPSTKLVDVTQQVFQYFLDATQRDSFALSKLKKNDLVVFKRNIDRQYAAAQKAEEERYANYSPIIRVMVRIIEWVQLRMGKRVPMDRQYAAVATQLSGEVDARLVKVGQQIKRTIKPDTLYKHLLGERTRLLTLLIANGRLNEDTRFAGGETVEHLAARIDDHNYIRYAERAAMFCNQEGKTPLDVALAAGNFRAASAFVARGHKAENVDDDVAKKWFGFAIDCDSVATVLYLLDNDLLNGGEKKMRIRLLEIPAQKTIEKLLDDPRLLGPNFSFREAINPSDEFAPTETYLHRLCKAIGKKGYLTESDYALLFAIARHESAQLESPPTTPRQLREQLQFTAMGPLCDEQGNIPTTYLNGHSFDKEFEDFLAMQ